MAAAEFCFFLPRRGVPSLLSLPPLDSEELLFLESDGTLGVLTGSNGELVRDLEEEKNLNGFCSVWGGGDEDAASNFALPLATAPVKK